MMLSAEQIARMSRDEKIQAMEAIWSDLSRTDADVESPEWHRELLEATETRLSAGREQAVDWSEAKRELRQRFE